MRVCGAGVYCPCTYVHNPSTCVYNRLLAMQLFQQSCHVLLFGCVFVHTICAQVVRDPHMIGAMRSGDIHTLCLSDRGAWMLRSEEAEVPVHTLCLHSKLHALVGTFLVLAQAMVKHQRHVASCPSNVPDRYEQQGMPRTVN
jgi:hypothetical protein